MYMRKTLPALVGCALLCTSILPAQSSRAQLSPELGVEATPAQIDAWALTILPDGSGLPAGSGTAAEGEIVYQQQCLVCHGAEGAGGPNDPLVGGHENIGTAMPIKTLGSYWPYATTVFDYIRRAMPYLQPQSMSNDEVYAVTAYLLALNGIIDADQVINAESLPAVEMPNAGNFVWAWGSD